MTTAFIITVDKIEEGLNKGKVINVRGPKVGFKDVREDPKRERFRMKDDDGIIYYEGFLVGAYEGFEPLDYFGVGAGCTSIEYWEKAPGEDKPSWRVL